MHVLYEVEWSITWGKDSFRKTAMKPILTRDNVNANIAGHNHQFPVRFNPHKVKAAPVIGPTMNPIENAIPTIALKEIQCYSVQIV